MFVIETPWNCTKYIKQMQNAGVNVVIRYYTKTVTQQLPEKRLELAEAQALCRAGFQLGAVYQFNARSPDAFSKSIGLTDGEYARRYASTALGQPSGSAIYFGVDYDASDDDIKDNVLPYFEGVSESFKTDDSSTRYDVGVYGSWKVCDRCVKSGLVKFAWLAQSTGWAGKDAYKKYADSRKWNLKQGFPTVDIGGLDYDPNEANEDKGLFGQFVISVGNVSNNLANRYVVSAKPNLRLRSGPGLDFDVIGTVNFGSQVTIVRRVGDWAFIDVDGDGGIDGVVHAGFLTSI